MQKIYKVQTSPCALDSNIVQGENYRITILTDGLLRLEYSPDGIFEDRATQMAFFRDFPQSSYRVIPTETGIEIHTDRIHMIYNEEEFSPHGLYIQVKGNLSLYHSTWHYGDEIHDLGGTARTLDGVNGSTPLEHGIVSRFGFSVLDDSHSQVLLDDGWIEPRKKGIQDLYFFGYGHDYKQALKDFYYLCGTTPMLPRYALGNWWSRYYKYTEQTYMELMDRFRQNQLPFSVAVLDMDWHLVDIDPKYGSGWTGYTWNRDFFPDPPRFLKGLHDRGMKVTLNVHPASGVQAHEEMYLEIAKEMGVDYEHEDPVVCDPADPHFLEAYFKYLHHPREEEGVDFWWIDWQQGSHSKIEGLDPLWIFNHFHYLDNGRDGKRPLTFSRYSGPGSHRYPIGFSGDAHTTWESLDFQPYFTSTASNIGYGWWSHDIGGHMMGYKDDELVARWTQYGIYSPIMRLHSTNSEFNGKEPWRFKPETEKAMEDALRERHRMVPYLYTMNYRNYHDGLPLVLPMYYEYPEEDAAYERKNQFLFGSQLMVAPVTSKRITGINCAKVTAWLPAGTWYDIHAGLIYAGDRTIDLYRDIHSIPVLAKAGAILPFTDEIGENNVSANPSSLHLKVYGGADGCFTLYEDGSEDCSYEKGSCATTVLEYREADDVSFTIHRPEGDLSLLPEKRSFLAELNGFSKEAAEHVTVSADGKPVSVSVDYDCEKQAVLVSIPETPVTQEICIRTEKRFLSLNNNVQKRSFDFLNQAEIAFTLKEDIYALIQKEARLPVLLSALASLMLDKDLYGALLEILTADSF